MLQKLARMASGVVVLTHLSLSAMAAGHETPVETTTSHGLSAFGDLKYAKDFSHFEYVNPDAPKGGRLATLPSLALPTFDSFNAFILKGDYAPGLLLGSSDGSSLVFDSLMADAGDEPDSMYGLVAYEVEYPQDRSWVIFRLRSEARFHDGSPLTADDVVFSLDILKDEGHPIYVQNLRDVLKAEALDPYTVRYTFDPDAVKRDLPLIVAGLPIFSKKYYADKVFGDSSIEPPLASGPYKVGDFKLGTYVEYDRVDDYWAKDLPVNVGRWNFDQIRYEIFRDRNVAFEAFKAGAYDLREELTSRIWATQYDFAGIRDGLVERRELTNENPAGVQGYFLNMRREKLSDARVREALGLAFDFEWTNKTIFYGAYQRTHSFFQGSNELAAAGPPNDGELTLLQPFRETLPPVVFERAYKPPVTDGSGRNRANLLKAKNLLKDAGWSIVDGKLANSDGEPMELEFLMYDSGFERINGPYLKNLELLGVDAVMRLVDPAQYQSRHEKFDFDIVATRYTQRSTPGVELRNYFSSVSAGVQGTSNLSGVADPIVDTLVESVVSAQTRGDLVAASRALDRVLREGHYWVPQWNKPWHNIAYWKRFGWPETEPKYNRGILDTWWSTDTAIGETSN